MFWLGNGLRQASIVAAFLVLPRLAVADLPPPEETLPSHPAPEQVAPAQAPPVVVPTLPGVAYKTLDPNPHILVRPAPEFLHPGEVANIPEPQGMVQHMVEKPSPRRPPPPIPVNALEPKPVPEGIVQYDTSFEPTLSNRDIPPKPPCLLAPITLTLRDAILLALRYNPNVESSQLTRIDDKYNLYLAQRVFVPQYTLGGGATFSSSARPIYAANAGVTLRTPLGTQFGLNYATTFPLQNQSSFGAAVFSVTQPLLQGFGFVNKVPLLNAYDTEEIAKLNFRSSIISTVTEVINAYRQLVSDYNNLDIQKSNLVITQTTMDQYRLQLKAGKMSPSDIIAQEAQLAQAKLSYEQQRIIVDQDYRSFLQDLGLSLNANIKINRKIELGNYHIPSEREAIAVALENNIQYQQALLALRELERIVIVAQNARLPTLNVVATQTFRPSNLGRPNNLILPQVGAGQDTTSSSLVAVNLNIPIDNVLGKSNYIAAKIAVMQAKLQLSQQKETLVTTILNDLAQLKSLREQVTISEQSVIAQRKTFESYELKLRYGKATVFEVTQNQTLYLNQALQLVSLEISFLNQITSFDSDLGTTLDAWNIRLRY